MEHFNKDVQSDRDWSAASRMVLAALAALTFIANVAVARAAVMPGDVITPANASKVKDLVSPGVYYKVENGMTMKVVPSGLIAFLAAQAVVPSMLKRGGGVIIFTGATAGVKPFATSAAFGLAKFAIRGLARVMGRDLQPQGIHVAYVNVDGAIDMPAIRERFPQLTADDMLKAVRDRGDPLEYRASGSQRMVSRS